VLDPEIEKLLGPLRELIGSLGSADSVTNLHVALADTGIDMTIAAGSIFRKRDIPSIIEFAELHNISRISWNHEEDITVIVTNRNVQIRMAGITLDLPPMAFQQASRSAQDFLVTTVKNAVSKSTRIGDIYSGCGTYSFPLAEAGHHVTAYEGDPQMVASASVAGETFENRFRIIQRDLFIDPLKGEELRRFDAVIINPPRNGAEPQMQAIAFSEVPRVVVISCNPVSLERDIRHLKEKGYHLVSAVPVDQFHWSTQLECVVVFSRFEEFDGMEY
jgi:23S rRNA (uracil1939-C5)-methyltransferase